MTQDDRIGAALEFLEEQAPLVYLRFDSQGRVLEANRYARERLGRDPCGDSVHNIFFCFGHPLNLEALRQSAGETHLLNITTIEGLPETFHFRISPLEEETLAFGHVDQDESSRLKVELIDLNNRLNELTREIQKQNHELERLNRLKDQFLAMAAHDLRKPVGAIISYTEFLLDEAANTLNEEQLGFLRTVHESTALMLSVIDEFLDISIIESGNLELGLARSDIREPINASIRLNEITARQKAVDLRFEGHGPVPLIQMDAAKVEQVVNNLISNAIEHTPDGSEVVVRLDATDEWVEVSVEDQGPGITSGEQEELFSPFVRGRSRKRPDSKGAGLGLAISKKIVDAHGGSIHAGGQLGKGAVFNFRLPVQDDDERHAR